LAKLRFEDLKTDDFADGDLTVIPEELYRIDLDDLCDFFINPAKYFLEKCLQVYPQIRELPELEDCESFEIENGLERYKLADSIIKRYLPEWSSYGKEELREALRKRFHAEGLLPVRTWGDIEFDKFFEDFLPFAEKLSPVISQPAEAVTKEQHFDNGVLLQAKFDDLYIVDGETKQIQFKYSNIKDKAKHLIRASLYGLAACAMEAVPGKTESQLIGRDKDEIFAPQNAGAAREKLSRLTNLYLEGLKRPLEFFPNASLAYAGKDDINAALKKWNSSRNYSTGKTIPGDGDDAYINCCFGKTLKATDEFKKISGEIAEALGL
jgi:exodeoxyribonuclease V gamma subunit